MSIRKRRNLCKKSNSKKRWSLQTNLSRPILRKFQWKVIRKNRVHNNSTDLSSRKWYTDLKARPKKVRRTKKMSNELRLKGMSSLENKGSKSIERKVIRLLKDSKKKKKVNSSPSRKDIRTKRETMIRNPIRKVKRGNLHHFIKNICMEIGENQDRRFMLLLRLRSHLCQLRS